MNRSKLLKIKTKSAGFALSLESLLAATVFSLTAALTWSLVWNGLHRSMESKKEMETTIFLANKIYESNFQETLFAKKKDQFSKDYSDTIFKKIFKANRSEIAEKSELKPLEKLLQKVVFDCKTPNSAKIETDSETDNFKLIAFLPFLKEG